MITLITPKESENRYLNFNGQFIVGPFGATSLRAEGVSIPFNSTLRDLQQQKGIFHENHVDHIELTGDLVYHPMAYGIIPFPTALLPRQIKYPVIFQGAPTLGTVPFGLAFDKGVSIKFSDQQVTQIAWTKIDTLKWKYLEVVAFRSSPTLVTNITSFTFFPKVRSGEDYCVISSDYKFDALIFGGGRPFSNMSSQLDYDTLMSLEHYAAATGSHTEPLGGFYKANADAMFSPGTQRERIDSLLATLIPGEFPVPDKHFGDLAMEASQSALALSANMIAFIKDLRHPSRMIPKLKKLKSLKSMSNDYLAVNYGLLPTVSDLRRIERAFKKRSPYLDSNGFTVYTAGFSDKLVKDGLSYTLLQRIKLAIDDEDDEFQALVSRAESIGIYPTFENIWDLVPFSFVLDWFIDVGGFLERIDTRLRLIRFNIRYVTMSRKTSVKGQVLSSKNAPFVGTIETVHYHRWVSDQCPVPPLSLNTTFQLPSHWLEAGALLAQRTR